MAKLILSTNQTYEGSPFGALTHATGEVVFATGMTGYPQSFTDPSFAGQILVMTYPLIGNYGVPKNILWETDRMHIKGLVVSTYIDTPSHYQSVQTLSQWLKKAGIPGIMISDTRQLTATLRDHGVSLGKIVQLEKEEVDFYDPNVTNLVSEVSTSKVIHQSHTDLDPLHQTMYATKSLHKTIVIIDCGAKRNIARCFLRRGVNTITVPWDFDPFSQHLSFDGLFISNGPGNPVYCDKTIETVKKALAQKIPTLGICLGNQILALAAGGETFKLKFGHRSQNQPCRLVDSPRCFITSQNHGFAIKQVPMDFEPWFINANDNTIEGIKHTSLPFMAVQFHPEANPGPTDTEWIFDYFLERVT